MKPEHVKWLWNFVRKHDDVIVSPLKEHAIMVPDPADPRIIAEEPKRLRQVSVGRLHKDFCVEVEKLQSTCANTADVIPKIGDNTFRLNMPPDVKPMSNRHREMCSCGICQQMKMLQETLNRFMRQKVLPEGHRLHNTRRSGSRRRNFKKLLDNFENGLNKKETPREALNAVHCKFTTREGDPSPIPGLIHMDCAFNWCPRCPQRKMHEFVEMLIKMDKINFITFTAHELVCSCTIH